MWDALDTALSKSPAIKFDSARRALSAISSGDYEPEALLVEAALMVKEEWDWWREFTVRLNPHRMEYIRDMLAVGEEATFELIRMTVEGTRRMGPQERANVGIALGNGLLFEEALAIEPALNATNPVDDDAKKKLEDALSKSNTDTIKDLLKTVPVIGEILSTLVDVIMEVKDVVQGRAETPSTPQAPPKKP